MRVGGYGVDLVGRRLCARLQRLPAAATAERESSTRDETIVRCPRPLSVLHAILLLSRLMYLLGQVHAAEKSVESKTFTCKPRCCYSQTIPPPAHGYCPSLWSCACPCLSPTLRHACRAGRKRKASCKAFRQPCRRSQAQAPDTHHLERLRPRYRSLAQRTCELRSFSPAHYSSPNVTTIITGGRVLKTRCC